MIKCKRIPSKLYWKWISYAISTGVSQMKSWRCVSTGSPYEHDDVTADIYNSALISLRPGRNCPYFVGKFSNQSEWDNITLRWLKLNSNFLPWVPLTISIYLENDLAPDRRMIIIRTNDVNCQHCVWRNIASRGRIGFMPHTPRNTHITYLMFCCGSILVNSPYLSRLLYCHPDLLTIAETTVNWFWRHD